jgi:hypothetical protein
MKELAELFHGQNNSQPEQSREDENAKRASAEEIFHEENVAQLEKNQNFAPRNPGAGGERPNHNLPSLSPEAEQRATRAGMRVDWKSTPIG